MYKAIVQRYVASGLSAEKYLEVILKEFKPSTYSLHLITLRNHFAELVSIGAATENPFTHYKSLDTTPNSQEDRLPLSDKEIEKLANAIISRHFGLRDSAILGLLFLGCMRVSEVASLRSVDTRSNALIFRNANGKRAFRNLGRHMNELLTEFLTNRKSPPRHGEPGPLFDLSVRGIQEMVNRAFSSLQIRRPGISADALRTAYSVAACTAGTHSNSDEDRGWQSRVCGLYLTQATKTGPAPIG